MGHIAGINDVVGFHGERVSELESAFHEALDDYIKAYAMVGKAPKPCSGRVMFQWAEEAMIQKAEFVLASDMAWISRTGAERT